MARQLFQLVFIACAVGVAGYIAIETPGMAAPPADGTSEPPLSVEDSLPEPAAESAAVKAVAEPVVVADRYLAVAEPQRLPPVDVKPAPTAPAIPPATTTATAPQPRQIKMAAPPLARTPRSSARPFESRPRHTSAPVRRAGYFTDEPQSTSADSTAFPAAQTSGPAATGAESGSQTGVSLTWIMPETANTGEQIRATIVVHNGGPDTAHEVTVDAELPPGLALLESRPAGESQGPLANWALGEIAGGQSRRIELVLSAEGEGSLAPAATVHTTQAAATQIKVTRPQLEIRGEGAAQWQLGRPETIVFTVTNTGHSEATGVRIAVRLPEGIEHSSGREVQYALGALAPGESRPIELLLSASKAGAFRVEAVAAVNTGAVDTAACEFEVQSPRLELAASGPKLRYVDRPATYTVTVNNPGPAPASNVRVTLSVPPGMRFAAASAGGSYDAGEQVVQWFLGRLEIETAAEVSVELVPQEAGEQTLAAQATADAGGEAAASCLTQVEAISALDLELVEGDDPLEVGAETVHVIRVTNRGSKPATQIEVAVRLGEELTAVAATGPVHATTNEGDVVFAPLAELPPGETAAFEIRVQGAKAGACRMTTFVRSQEQPDPAQAEVITTVYDE